MSDTKRSPNPFVPNVVLVWDDNCDPLERQKSILKKENYEIGLGASGEVWTMAGNRLDRPVAARRKKDMDPQTQGKRAKEAPGRRDS